MMKQTLLPRRKAMVNVQVDKDIIMSIFELEHAEKLFQLIEENREHLGRWLRFAHETSTVDDSRKFIARSLYKYASNNGFWAGIWYQGVLVGAIGLLHIDEENQCTEIGYYLAKSYEGRGIITRACRTVIAYVFEELKLNRVVIRTMPDNVGSRNIAEKLGFTQEGILRKCIWFNHRFVDQVVYGLLKEDWDEQKGNESK
jgi:ribosomal-protein-serine acetyltransferase